MKCKVCGTELEHGCKVCPNCDTPITVPYSGTQRAKNKFGQIIKRYEYKADGNARLLAGLLWACFLGFISHRAFSALDNINSYFQSSLYDGVSAVGFICIFLSLFNIAEGFFNKYLYNSRFLSVNEFGIAGVGPSRSLLGFFDYKNENYEIMYSDITSIQRESRGLKLCINTNFSKVYITLPNKSFKDATNAIEQASGISIK